MRSALMLFLLAAVFASAMATVLIRHKSRNLFIELQALHQQRDLIDEEWGRLQLEQATLATHSRVEQIAQGKLGMMVPTGNSVVLVLQ